jgi:hypothetical protein
LGSNSNGKLFPPYILNDAAAFYLAQLHGRVRSYQQFITNPNALLSTAEEAPLLNQKKK